jgi:hypothetical protein
MGARYIWPVESAHLQPNTDGERNQNRAFEFAALVFSRGVVMLRRAIPAFVALIALSQTATAGVSCAVVRFYVAKYSEATAERWARSHGASDAEIETARRCLHHSANVQTASSAASSQVLAPVTEQERARHEPAERDSNQDALHDVSVQDQRADAEKDSRDDGSRVHGFIRPKEIEDRSGGHVSTENKDLVPSDGKTTILRPRHVGATHRAGSAGMTGHVTWLKRLWDHLVGRRRSSIALFAFPRSRSYNKISPFRHHLSGTVPSHGAG